MQLLLLSASARQNRSLTRALAADFVDQWRAKRPDDVIVQRDVGQNPPPFINEDWIAGAFCDAGSRTPAQIDALRASEELIDELVVSDLLVIATPMYNYGMPAALKSWFDQVVRVNRTFTFDLARGDQPIEPMQSGKTMVILSALGEGGFLDGGANASENHLHPHILKAGELLGFEHHEIIAIEYQEFGDERFEKSRADAHNAIGGLVDKLIQQRGE